jgi:CheY-like chemotaxis protein
MKMEIPPFTRKILVAEDSRTNQLYISEILKQIGYEAVVAANGEEVLHRVSQDRFDMVLMDCQMPVMDGYEATKKIRSMQEEGGIDHFPVIALTGSALKGEKERCLAAGMDDYLLKPVRREALEGAVRRWVTQE